MCGDCWNAAMGAPAVVVAARFAWVGYRDRIPFPRTREPAAVDGPEEGAEPPEAPDLVDSGAPSP